MDQEILADAPPIQEGYDFLRRVMRAGLTNLKLAFWVKETPDSLWNLWVALDVQNKSDLLTAYAYFARESSKEPSIRLSRLNLIPVTDQKVQLMGVTRNLIFDGRVGILGPQQADALKPFGWYQVVLYPKFGLMHSAEVAAFITRELSRTDASVPVILSMADGETIRGYPLAIRKSPLGGAIVELADPETRVKGRDVSLSDIYSVVPDQLSS